MSLGSCKTKAIKLINEHSVNGSLNSIATNADYTLRMNDLADIAQKEVATIKKINAAFTITQNAIPNVLGQLTSFDLIQHLATDLSYAYAAAKSYYFEVDRACTVYIEEEQTTGVWTVLETITVPTITVFTAYKGLIAAVGATNNVRLRFSGSYPYNIRNRALYLYTFPTAAEVQVYKHWVKYDLPTDFMELKKIINEGDPRQYNILSDYKTEGRNSILLNFSMRGSFRIEYYKFPITIDSTTDDAAEFEIDTAAQELIPYYLAAHMLMDESPSRGTLLLNMYQAKLGNLYTSDNINSNLTSNTMSW